MNIIPKERAKIMRIKKYWTIFKLELQTDMQYRFNFLAGIFGNALVLVFFFYFWIKIYAEGNKIGNYDLKGLLTYYFLSFIWSFLLFRDLGMFVSDEIREGHINNFLLKPFNYLANHFSQYWAGVLSTSTHYAPIIAVAAAFLYRFFTCPSSFTQWIFFACSFVLAALIYFFIFYNIGLLGFWFGSIWSINYAILIFINFMGGRHIPVDLFPSWLEKVSVYLPFRYMVYEPVAIFLNKVNIENFQSLLIPSVWVIFLFFLSRVLWERGIKVYEAYGA